MVLGGSAGLPGAGAWARAIAGAKAAAPATTPAVFSIVRRDIDVVAFMRSSRDQGGATVAEASGVRNWRGRDHFTSGPDRGLMGMKTQDGILVLADISGFTAFVTATELEHGPQIIKTLLEA